MEATHYCRGYADCSYAGQPLGCGNGVYDPYDPTIVAVGPSRYAEWPCGTKLRVCARETFPSLQGGPFLGGYQELVVPGMWCINVARQDSCPGCGHYLLDLSEAAFEALGFRLEQGVGRVTVERME